MKNDLTKTIFYLDLKHVHKYGSAKFQPNPFFSSQQMATEHVESAAEKKCRQTTGDPVRTGCSNKSSKSSQLLFLCYMQDEDIVLNSFIITSSHRYWCLCFLIIHTIRLCQQYIDIMPSIPTQFCNT